MSQLALHSNLINEEIVYLLQLLNLNVDNSTEAYDNNYYTLLEHLTNSDYFENEGSNYEITKEQVRTFIIRGANNMLVECLQILNLNVDNSWDNIV